MQNQNTEKAWEYHDCTKHSPESVRRNAHFMDWENQPLPFKIYPDLNPQALPQDLEQTGVAALSAIAAPSAPSHHVTPSLKDLARLLYFSAGITRRRRYPGGELLFRAAACTGALYEIELYLVCGPLQDLAAGVYHFNPGDFALRRLREGDYRDVIVTACGREPSVVHSPAMIISTGTYWRNAWKYQARTYRHFGWDGGTILAHLLAAAVSAGLPAHLVCGFVDAEFARLLGLDVEREVALSLVALGQVASTPPASPLVAPLELATVPLSRKEVDYPAMREIHAVSSLVTPEEVAAWCNQATQFPAVPLPQQFVPLDLLSDEQLPADSLEEVIIRRGSTRRFRRESITFTQFSTILDTSTRGIAADFLPAEGQLNELYVIANAVEGLDPGAYFYSRTVRGLVKLKQQNFRAEAAHLALDQDLAGDAAAAVFFLADLKLWIKRFGNRGYRLVQLEAGILGGRMYLAAYAQRLGATGLTFYDDEVVSFFSPHAAGKSAIFLVALGLSKPRSSL